MPDGRDEMGWGGVGEQVLQGSFEAVGLGGGVLGKVLVNGQLQEGECSMNGGSDDQGDAR
ncbi:hypothetical protein ACH4VX_35425 [Streptomyces sp. NPDC020731]|uniref:hypothetical protein n=1 Tax=Streptomyces sp. NPDC020731 TaxID=3365085 RepID=UPI0037BBC554